MVAGLWTDATLVLVLCLFSFSSLGPLHPEAIGVLPLGAIAGSRCGCAFVLGALTFDPSLSSLFFLNLQGKREEEGLDKVND